MTMTCRELAEFVMGYLDGELEADLRRRFDAHLAECPDCVRYLGEYRATVRAGREAYADTGGDADDLPADVPDDLVKAILAARSTVRDKTP
jgi:anti-sigma factor RsiW